MNASSALVVDGRANYALISSLIRVRVDDVESADGNVPQTHAHQTDSVISIEGNVTAMKPDFFAVLTLTVAGAFATASNADTTDARCEIYPKGSDELEKVVACTFSQRQGFITIRRDDGITHDLRPVGESPGNFRDQNDHAVYRQSGLGREGQIFRFPDSSIYLYWDTSPMQPHASDADNPTAPFTTKYRGGKYDATTLLRCKATGDSEFGSCPAGILRMEDNQASIVIRNPLGKELTLNFMTDYVNSTVGEVKANLDGDTWTVTRDNGEVYEVPQAAIEGG